MSQTENDFSSVSFAKTFVLPALLIFLIPILSLLFFRHVQNHYDQEARAEFLRQIQADQTIPADEKAELEKLYNEIPLSQLVQHEEFADMLTAEGRFDYTTFRWAIRLSWYSIIGGIIVFALVGICVLASLRSQYVQYISLSVGWHVLRIYGATQVAIQGLLLFALSYWVTAFWFEIFIPKLILIAGLLALVAIGAVIVAIFKRPTQEFAAEGEVIGKDSSMPLWQELDKICQKVGTQPPDQMIAGIDDNFYVTEQPITVGEKTVTGRTLFVSLSLLKQLEGGEADAVLAHEMAHFSGNDTLYSQKISPLLVRYGNYLQALHDGGITLPVFYFMHCFRALYEISLGRLSREREFRADRIATEVTSPRDMAGALLRIVAYSAYRGKVEQDLFMQEEVLEAANVSEQIEEGFHAYAASFLSNPDIGNLETSHPFDSHPPLVERLQAVGLALNSEQSQQMLGMAGDGLWFQKIQSAEQLEREQWDEFEEKFRSYHEETLPYRFIPETEAELAIVLRAFPGVEFTGKDGTLKLTYDHVEFSTWTAPIHYSEIENCQLDDNSVLTISQTTKSNDRIKMKKFPNQQEVLEAFQHYYSRYLSAKEYQEHVREIKQESDIASE